VRRAPANIQLRRAQIILMLAGLVPTVLMTATGIVLLAIGSGGVVVAAVLVLAFCTSAVTGYILGTVFLSKGAEYARFQNDYVSAVSHELNTPLTSIRMFIDTLRREDALDPTEKMKCLQLLDQEIQRLDGLVARLFELSRMESGRHQFDRERVLIDDLVADVLSAFAAATLNHPVQIELDVDKGLEVVGDHAAITQALTNLLTNAWKYTPAEGKHIALSAHARGKWVEIEVSDNGQGIPRGEQRQIFQQFERGRHATQSGAQGAGLGLAIVRAIIGGHRGKIELHSEAGTGTTLTIQLPRYRSS